MNNSEIWQAVLAELELSISKANFITWFKNTGIVALADGCVLVCVPNTFARAWLEKKYHQFIIRSLERITNKPIKKLDYKIDNIKNVIEQTAAAVCEKTEPVSMNMPAPTPAPAMAGVSAAAASFFIPPANPSPTGYIPSRSPQNISGGFVLNPKYGFNNFVVGKGSELAYAAAQAVTSKPGIAYNPLFIYGGVGLGKTHLLQAIGNHILQNNPDFNIMYVSAEKFSNDFISSVQEGKARDFQNRYRTIDLLLIDDIQFIAGKDRTQESFFHTFNELHQQNKQVVLTSDRPPKAIPALEDRLKSRFEWGMIADVAPPDFETRVAILEKKCLEKSFTLEMKILQNVALVVQNNIRELEGALNKIIVYHQLKNIAPTVETVKSLLSSLESVSMRRSITSKQLIEVVGQFYNVEMEPLLGKSREKKLSFPRQIIMFLMRQELKMSFPSIGDELGGRDHTTAMHAYSKILRELENDLKLKQELELLKQRIYINTI